MSRPPKTQDKPNLPSSSLVHSPALEPNAKSLKIITHKRLDCNSFFSNKKAGIAPAFYFLTNFQDHSSILQKLPRSSLFSAFS
jgi:hypothetical protein